MYFVFLLIRRPPVSTRPVTLFPFTTLFLSTQVVPEALRRGATAVLAAPGAVRYDSLGGAILIEDEKPRRRFALLAAEFYGRQPRTLVAVTGTNGKSSVVDFTRQTWQQPGKTAASLGKRGAVGHGFENGRAAGRER